ncbi:MAG: hypothetical protein WC854_02170 [Bacteroidales bacterium]
MHPEVVDEQAGQMPKMLTLTFDPAKTSVDSLNKNWLLPDILLKSTEPMIKPIMP